MKDQHQEGSPDVANQEHDDYIAMIPAGGWRIERTLDDGTTESHPLVGWALLSDGFASPLTTDDMGVAGEPWGFNYRIYHPDSEEYQPA